MDMKKILIVDDEPDLLRLLSYWLRQMGYHIVTAASGEDALTQVQAERPSLVFLDVQLPIIDGFEVCRRLKADKELKHIPVIFLTADASVRLTEASRAAEGSIVKPFLPKDILEHIRRWIPENGIKAA
jgi:CheY-like chemotaxis protein